MNTNANITPPIATGQPFEGGFFAGRIRVGEVQYALIIAPKEGGERSDGDWIDDNEDIPNAISFFDGLSNTNAMAEARSELAQWSRNLRIGGYEDWYIPSQDELEILYRNLKPTVDANWCYWRSGINLSALPPTYPYTSDMPAQTPSEFKQGSDQAFDPTWYWSSTQHAAYSDSAWFQHFSNGFQGNNFKSGECRARAVRRVAI